MRRLLLTLSACLALTAPVHAQECRSVPDAVAYLHAMPAVVDVYVANPAEAKNAVDILNAMPPESDDKFTDVILVTGGNGQGLIVLGNDGQMCSAIALPVGTWRIFVRSVRGEGV